MSLEDDGHDGEEDEREFDETGVCTSTRTAAPSGRGRRPKAAPGLGRARESAHETLFSDRDFEDEPEQSFDTAAPYPPSNRTSIDGMDPTFASILCSSSTRSRGSFTLARSNSSLRFTFVSGSSKLRSPVLSRRRGGGGGGTVGSRRRGGVGYQQVCPASGEAEALSAEFGLGGMDSVVEDEEEPMVFVEFGCQTDVPDSRALDT